MSDTMISERSEGPSDYIRNILHKISINYSVVLEVYVATPPYISATAVTRGSIFVLNWDAGVSWTR